MKFRTLLFSGIIFFISIISSDAKPAAEFEILTHDFGTIHINSTVKYSFKFKNTGDSVLIIDRIKTG